MTRPRPAAAPTRFAAASYVAAGLFALAGSSAAAGEPAAEDAALRFFENEVRPVLVERCGDCHGPDAQEGDLRLDSLGHLLAGGASGPAVEPGDPAASLLIEAVRYESYEMPPDGKLPDREVAALEKWVALGAPWPGSDDAPPVRPKENGPRFTDEDRAWWALRPVADPPAPDGIAGWGRNAVDRFVGEKMKAAGLAPAPEANRLTLIRRVTQTLTGLPPTPTEVDAFLADGRPDAYERLVDRLLNGPAYGERWARKWLDLVRYADSDGYRNDHHRPRAWRYRDYVVDRLNADVPYDRFVKEQLAGDELFPEDPAATVALGYLRCGIYEHNSRDAVGQRDLMLDELTDATADVFLGLGLQCARCHDHKFDPLLQTDYYRLRAYFEPLLFRDGVVLATAEERAAHAAAMEPWEAATAELRAELIELEADPRARAEAAAVEKFPAAAQTDYRTPDADRTARQRQIAWLVADQVRQEYDKLGTTYIPKEDRPRHAELKAAIAAFDHLKPPPLPTARTAADAGPLAPKTVVPKKRTEVSPGPIALLGEAPAAVPVEHPAVGPGTTGRRAALADWIADPDNPLSTRVIVNRVWQSHFGRGLAPNGSDFGALGGPPSHPELLDWLTRRFLDGGWRLKPLHRLVVTSAAYRQSSSHPRAAAFEIIDPANTLYWRADVRRLDAEQVRDALLAATGGPAPAAGGPGRPHAAPVRSLYLTVTRNDREPLLDLFDLPQFFQSAAARDTTTGPLQSLYLINGEAVLARARRLAGRAAAGDPAASVRNAWRAALGRNPDARELARAVRFLREQADRAAGAGDPGRAALVDLCHVLLNSSEFLYVP